MSMFAWMSRCNTVLFEKQKYYIIHRLGVSHGTQFPFMLFSFKKNCCHVWLMNIASKCFNGHWNEIRTFIRKANNTIYWIYFKWQIAQCSYVWKVPFEMRSHENECRSKSTGKKLHEAKILVVVHLKRARIHLDSSVQTDDIKKTFEPCKHFKLLLKTKSAFVNCLCNSSTHSQFKTRRSHKHIKSRVRAFAANAFRMSQWISRIQNVHISSR